MVSAKAKALLEDPARVTPDPEHDDLYWIKNHDGTRTYRVQVGDGYVTCTCPNGLHNGGSPSCYHAEVVKMLVNDVRTNGSTDGR